MNKFIISSIIQEIYSEILFVTYNYQKEIITEKEVSKFDNSDFVALSKSKFLSNYSKELPILDQKGEYNFDPEFLSILDGRAYDKEKCLYLIRYMNPYVEHYNNTVHEIIDKISFITDLNFKGEGFKGNYPLYVKVEENKLKMERLILSFNTRDFILRTTKKLKYKITFMEYDVPLNDYKYSNIDFKDKEVKEIISILDSSMKINLSHVKYYDTKYLDVLSEFGDITIPSEADISLWLKTRIKADGNIKNAIRTSLKRTFFTLLIIIILTILIIIIKNI